MKLLASAKRSAATLDKDRVFDTEHLKANLSSRSARGGAVTFASQITKFTLQTGSQVVLARLLTPADFGLIAMVSVVANFVNIFQDMGLTMATVQRKEINHRQVSVLFWINFAVSVVLGLFFAVLAPAIAWFYGEPELLWVTVAFGALFVFSGLGAQHRAVLRRQMRYTALGVTEIGAIALAIALAVVLAAMGGGYWALVGLFVGQPFFLALLLWIACPWRPGLPRPTQGVGSLLKFGGNLTGFNIINYATRNADNVMIGAVWGAAPLGYYSKAYGLLLLPIRQINGPLTAVALPALSRLQNEPERFERFYCRMLQVTAYLAMPLFAMVFVLAEDVVLVVLGGQWLEAIPIFRVLACLAFAQTVQNTTGWVMMAYDRTGRMFRWSFFQGTAAMASFAIGLSWGAYGVAVAAVICGLTMLIPGLLYSYHGTPVSMKSVGRALYRPLSLALWMTAVGAPLRALLSDELVAVRIASVSSASLAAAALLILVWRSMRQDLEHAQRTLRKKSEAI